MKCPFRLISKTKEVGIRGGIVTTTNDFAECYREECPMYSPERQVGSFIIPESCWMAKETKGETVCKSKSEQS